MGSNDQVKNMRCGRDGGGEGGGGRGIGKKGNEKEEKFLVSKTKLQFIPRKKKMDLCLNGL